MSAHPALSLLETSVRREAVSAVPVTAFCLSEPWSRAMSEPGKVQLGVNLLSAFTSTIAVALVLGLPMAVAIIWLCS